MMLVTRRRGRPTNAERAARNGGALPPSPPPKPPVQPRHEQLDEPVVYAPPAPAGRDGRTLVELTEAEMDVLRRFWDRHPKGSAA